METDHDTSIEQELVAAVRRAHRAAWVVQELENRIQGPVSWAVVNCTASFLETTGAELGLEPFPAAAHGARFIGTRKLRPALNLARDRGLVSSPRLPSESSREPVVLDPADAPWQAEVDKRLALLPLFSEQRLAYYAAAAYGLWAANQRLRFPFQAVVVNEASLYLPNVPDDYAGFAQQLGAIVQLITTRLGLPCPGQMLVCPACGTDLQDSGAVATTWLCGTADKALPAGYGVGHFDQDGLLVPSAFNALPVHYTADVATATCSACAASLAEQARDLKENYRAPSDF